MREAYSLKIGVIIFLFLILAVNANALYLQYDDSWDYSGSTKDDAVAWGSYELKARPQSYDSDADCLCWDWCDDGTDDNGADNWDDCICKSANAKNDCKYYLMIRNLDQNNRVWVDDLDGYRDVDTGNSGGSWSCGIDVIEYRDCDNSNSKRNVYNHLGTSGTPYYIINKKRYDCENSETYDGEGRYSGVWIDYFWGRSCGSNKACDEYYDDAEKDSATADMPDVCRIKDDEGDCDEDGDCFYGSYCDCQGGACWGDFAKDYCCPNGQEWDGSQCSSTCTEGWLGEYRCSSDMRQRKWQDKFCNTEWRDYKNCNDDDNTGSWTYYCPDDDNVKKKRAVANGYCDSGTKTCKTSSSEEQEIISQNGNSDFCTKRKDYSCSLCAYGRYDCDFDTECSTSAPDCVDYDGGTCGLGNECGCCNTGEKWDESANICKTPCSSHSYKSCYDNDVYWYDSCNAREDKYEECGASGYTGDNYCFDGDVYKDYIIRGCASASCTSSTERRKQEECNTAGCNNGACVVVQCGDGTCSAGENCPKDCLKIDSFYQLPSSVDEDDDVQIKVVIKNTGTVTQTGTVEAAIIPVNFFSQGYAIQGSSIDITGCCEANKYYDTRNVTRSAGESAYTTFNIKVPAKFSVDECDNDGSKRSAWGSSFIALAGAYDLCAKDGGTGYYSYIQNSINVNPLCSSSQCTSYSWRSCTNKGNFCCSQDDNDNNPNTAYPQYYCEDSLDYTSCSNDFGHTPCMKKGSKYCTEENGLWKFRDCSLGCGSGKCLTCNDNGICESGENSQNCPNDCEQDTNCGMPDGSSSDCDCNSNTDCTIFGDYYCNQVSGWDACEPIQYNDECSNYNDFFCENNWVKKCVNNGKYWEKQKIESCTGKYQYCDPSVVYGTGKCSKHPNNMDVWIDYADTGVDVNKQPGDKLKLNIFSEQDATVKITYNKNVFDSNDCFTFQIVKPGINTCSLAVKDGVGDINEQIKVENKITKVNIINNPELLIITDSEKLAQEFYQEPNAVKAVLKQAYANAERDKGVVYDLNWYKDELGVNNPFTLFINYVEKIIKSNMVDNSYSIEVSNFIKEKCGNCKDVMIVGDDFVVPSYRREIPTLTRNWFFWMKEDLKNIYTDIPYIKKSMLYLSEYPKIFENSEIVAKEGRYEGKDVLFILPDVTTPEQDTQITRLKKAFNDKGYKPDYSEMRGKDTFCLDERWFKNVSGRTLIIIGTEENNNAFKCMPFVFGDANLDSAFMQPNVWDTDEYALVINTDNPEVIGVLANLVETGEIINLKSESAYFFKVGVQYASYAALGVGVGSLILFTGGTAAPAALLAAGTALDWIADSGDVADTCVVNSESIGWCGGTIAMAALPYVPSRPAKNIIKKFADSGVNSRLKEVLDPANDLIKKHFKKLREVFGNIAFENAVKTAEDNVHLAKGAENVVKESGKNADEALKDFKRGFSNTQRGKTHALKTVVKFGKYSDEFFEASGLIRYSDTNKRVLRVDNRHPKDIFIDKDAGFKSRGDSLDYQGYVEKPDIPSRFIGASKTAEGGFTAAISTGNVKLGEGGSWTYIIDPRAKNFVNDLETLPNPGPLREIEKGVVAIDEIAPDDVVGVVYIRVRSTIDEDTGVILIDSWEITDEVIANPNYKGKFNLKNIDFAGGD